MRLESQQAVGALFLYHTKNFYIYFVFFRTFLIFAFVIEQILVWLWRIRHCLGFGIQSPWAYSFVREVVNEHSPYYAYEELDAMAELGGLSPLNRKMGRLYFRIANYLQPSLVLQIGQGVEAAESYFRRGCNKSSLVSVGDVGDIPTLSSHDKVLVRVSADATRGFDAGSVQQFARDGWMVVVEDIGRDSVAKNLWNELKEMQGGFITFDLYYCGVVYFDSKRHKEHFIVNF